MSKGKKVVAKKKDVVVMEEEEVEDDEEQDEYDEDGILISEAPRIYERAGRLQDVRPIAQMFLANHNEERPSERMNLILFDDALRHMLRVSRIIGSDRGNALLIGVGGSGKRSSTKLAAYIARQQTFQMAQHSHI